MLRFCVLIVALCFATVSLARADEGMWTFNNFPSAKVQKTYGFTPSAAFLDHVRKSSLRIAEGCSASFISPQGLVMTNHHCVVGCVGQLSTAQQNLVESGFLAKRAADEKACPDFELDQLQSIADVTKTVQGAIAGKTGAAATAALRAVTAGLEQSCGKDSAVLCEVVSLYRGGVYDLYHYKKYTDVRLVFAPEYAIGQFGGDPDNFNFPRFDFDIGLLRAYENGKPAVTPDYLRWSRNGSKAGDLVFVSGNPGQTQRELTTAQLAYIRRYQYPDEMPVLGEYRGILNEFGKLAPEQARESHEDLFFIENDYKEQLGEQHALDNPSFFGMVAGEKKRLRDAVAKKPALEAADGSAWDAIAKLQPLRAQLSPRQGVLNGFAFQRGLLGYARTLVRAAAERRKPNAQRLPGYTDQALVEVQQALSAPVPVYPDLEETTLAFEFSVARRTLGTDNALTQKMLGKESPEALAHRLVSGTKLGEPAVRKALFEGGQGAIDASTDPMIAYAKSLDPEARAIQKEVDDRINAPTRAAAEKIAKARFAVYGTSVDPDATFTARLSYGSVKGFVDGSGANVAPYTTIGGLFNRATPYAPYALPDSWLAAKSSLDMATPMNLSTSNDIIGGNSGSPLIDKNGDIVGLIFDGNIFSLGGTFGYDPAQNRAVAVDSRALLAGLSKVYHADRIVSEIESARGS